MFNPSLHHPTFFEQAQHRGNLLQSSLETQKLARGQTVSLQSRPRSYAGSLPEPDGTAVRPDAEASVCVLLAPN